MDDEGSRLLAREAASGDVDAWMRWRRSLRMETDLDLEEALDRIIRACLKIHREEARTEVVDEKPKTLEVAAEDCDYVG